MQTDLCVLQIVGAYLFCGVGGAHKKKVTLKRLQSKTAQNHLKKDEAIR